MSDSQPFPSNSTPHDKRAGCSSPSHGSAVSPPCPICGSPARWVLLFQQRGELGLKQLTETLTKYFARASALAVNGCSSEGTGIQLRLRSKAHRFPTHHDYTNAYREATKALGICPDCYRRKPPIGYVLCAVCRARRARKKRMARQIGKKLCGCGKPAVNVSAGEYICADCWRIEHGGRDPQNKQAEARRI